jgi:hypothetical protein
MAEFTQKFIESGKGRLAQNPEAEDKMGKTAAGENAVIAIGMSEAELNKVISEFGCKEITQNIGVKRGYSPEFLELHEVSSRWILTPDASCLSIHLSRLKSEPTLRIDSIVKGPAGKGYPGKIEWRNLERETVEKVFISR